MKGGNLVAIPVNAKEMNDASLYYIKVKPYMTKKTEPSESFDFMAKWNSNVPMPSLQMFGKKTKETGGMVFMELKTISHPFKSWNGWIVKSAIVSEHILNDAEIANYKARMSFEVIIYIARIKSSYKAKISLSSPNSDVTNLLRSKYGAKPNKELWDVSIDDVNDIYKDLVANYRVRVVNPDNYNRFDVFRYKDPEISKNYPVIDFKTKPFPHQMKAYQYGMERDRILIADDMGLGKSLESITIALGKKQQYGLKHCLVICGVNSLKWNWVQEIEEHSNEKAYVLGQRKKRDGTYRVGTNADKIKDLKNIDSVEEFFIITNVESLQNDDITKLLCDLCERKIIDISIADEFHKMKNTESKQGKNTMKVRTKYQVALTGTPVLNSPLDLYAILCWLGYEKKSFYSFKSFYTRKGEHNKVVGYRNMHILQENLSKIMLRRRKEDVLDLPEKQYKNILLEMPKDQLTIYNEVREALLNEIDLIELSPDPLARLIRLRQATAHTCILSSTISESIKIECMKELVAELVAESRKVIVFSNWTEVTDIVGDALSEYNPLFITGKTKDDERIRIKDEFQNNPERMVIVGTIGAMGTGLTMTAAEAVIFMDEPWTNGAKEQAVDRAHRIGQKNNVLIYTLMCKDTIDERVHRIVETKGDISDVMVDKKKAAGMVKFLLGLTDELR